MKKDSVYVRHIIDAINKIEQYVQIGHEDFIVHRTGRTRLSGNSRSLEKRQNACRRIFDNPTQRCLGAE